jgi:hypothetical protein
MFGLVFRACLLVVAFIGWPATPKADEFVNLDQGWSIKQKVAWYTRSQGSRLIPLSWFRALEQPGQAPSAGRRMFLDPAYIRTFGYLPSDSGPGRLPIGFAIDTQDDSNFSEITRLRWKSAQSSRESWVGLNCAACHTAEMTYQGKRLRVEGGPTLADFQRFMKAYRGALVETRDDSGKWNRFASDVLKGADRPSNRAMLKSELGKLIDWQLKVEAANDTPLQYGYGRLDAFGHIFNKVLLRVEASDAQPKNPSDAPVSYPFLWNIHQHDKVQWNGIAPNMRAPLSPSLDIGALGRNVGEVIGVFADLKLRPPFLAITGYRSSVRVDNLVYLEQLVSQLKPPAWPDVFPPIDANLWEAGRDLFKAGCAGCHTPLQRDDLTTRIKAQMTPLGGQKPIGTDPWMACNAYSYEARTGVLELTPEKFIVGSSVPLKDRAAVADMLGTTVVGVLWNKKKDVLDNFGMPVTPDLAVFEQQKALVTIDPNATLQKLLATVHDDTKADRLKRCMSDTSSPILAYKGRPLTGIWATPPYLHNGSVPTLYDLLLPPSERPASFSLGTREFDPSKVGYVTAPAPDGRATWPDDIFVFKTRDDAGQPIQGNLNDGHDYGNAAFKPEERMALIEYMKAIGGRRVKDPSGDAAKDKIAP